MLTYLQIQLYGIVGLMIAMNNFTNWCFLALLVIVMQISLRQNAKRNKFDYRFLKSLNRLSVYKN